MAALWLQFTIMVMVQLPITTAQQLESIENLMRMFQTLQVILNILMDTRIVKLSSRGICDSIIVNLLTNNAPKIHEVNNQ